MDLSVQIHCAQYVLKFTSDLQNTSRGKWHRSLKYILKKLVYWTAKRFQTDSQDMVRRMENIIDKRIRKQLNLLSSTADVGMK